MAVWCCVLVMAGGAEAQQVSVTIPPPDGPTSTGLSAPILHGASNCSKEDWRLSVSGGVPGATYEVYATVGTPPMYVEPLGEFPVNPNADGITVIDVFVNHPFPDLAVKQRVGSVTPVWSPFSKPIVRRDPAQLPTPEIAATPLFECGRATVVTGHQPGDQVTLMSENKFGVRFTIPSAFGLFDFMPAGGPGPFKGGENLSVQYSTCQGAPQSSSPSAAHTAQGFPGQLPVVEIRAESLASGVPRFQLEGAVNGALVQLELVRGSSSTTWSEVCPEAHCVVHVPTALGGLVGGDRLGATQELCPGSTSQPGSNEVKTCGDTPAAELSPQPQHGQTELRLSRYPMGSLIRVYATKSVNPAVNLEMIGYAYDTPLIELTRAIEASDLWILVAIDSPGCPASQAAGYSLVW